MDSQSFRIIRGGGLASERTAFATHKLQGLAAGLTVGLPWFAELPAQQVEPAEEQDKHCANSQQKDRRRRSTMVNPVVISPTRSMSTASLLSALEPFTRFDIGRCTSKSADAGLIKAAASLTLP